MAGMSPEEVKSECSKLEVSPSKNQASSPIYRGGSKSTSGKPTSAMHGSSHGDKKKY